MKVTTPGGPRRWREQRWLVDETIRSNGIEWDQPRLGYTLGPVVGEQSASDIAVLRTRIHKVADFVPAVSSVAARHEHLARQAEDEGHGVTAEEHWHAAAMLWSLAVWPPGWLLDRVNGVPMKDEFRYVTATGAVEQRRHPRLS